MPEVLRIEERHAVEHAGESPGDLLSMDKIWDILRIKHDPAKEATVLQEFKQELARWRRKRPVYNQRRMEVEHTDQSTSLEENEGEDSELKMSLED